MKRHVDAHPIALPTETLRCLSFDLEGGDTLGALTESERDIVLHLARGGSNAAIARARGTSVRTIANQLSTLYARLGVRDRHELTCLALAGHPLDSGPGG